MAEGTDSLLMRIALDTADLKKGVDDLQKQTGKIEGMGKGIASMGSSIKGAFAFAGINLGMKALMRNSKELTDAMKPIHELIGKFGDQLAPGFRILAKTIQDLTGHVKKMGDGVGDANIIARAFAVTMTLVSFLLKGLINGLILLYNTVRAAFWSYVTIQIAGFVLILKYLKFVCEMWEFLGRVAMTVFKVVAQFWSEYVVMPIAKGIIFLLEKFLLLANSIPDAFMPDGVKEKIMTMNLALESMGAAVDAAGQKHQTMGEIWDETAGKVPFFSQAVTDLGTTIGAVSEAGLQALNKAENGIEHLGDNIQEMNIPGMIKEVTDAATGVGPAFTPPVEVASWAAAFKTAFSEMGKAATDFQTVMTARIGLVKNSVQSFTTGAGQQFANFFQNLTTGAGNAGDKLLAGMLGVIGDLLIQWGTFFLLTGVGMLFVPGMQASAAGAIAAGLALIAAGGVTKGLAANMTSKGEAQDAGAGGGGGGGFVGGSSDVDPLGVGEQKQKPQTHVVVNITGADLIPRDEWQRTVREHIAPAIQRIVRDEGVTVIDGVFPSGV